MLSNISYTNTTPGQIWNCTAVAFDGFNYSINRSAAVTINNGPNTPIVNITSSSGYNSTNDNLTCSAVLTEASAMRLMNATVNWTRNGAWFQTEYYNYSYANATFFRANLSSSNVTLNDNWSCAIRLYDGDQYSNWGSSGQLTIINNAPNMSTARIAPIPAYTNDTLLGYCNATDIDNNNVSYYWQWFRNGVAYSNGSITNWCYQETANISQCSGLATGLYSNPTPTKWVNANNAIDGNWSTAASAGSNKDDALLLVNYTKPSTAMSSSIWQVKMNTSGTMHNLSIPSLCWNQNNLQFYIDSGDYDPDMWSSVSCYNGTGWQNILDYPTAKNFYEEAMYWSIRIAYTPGQETNLANITENATTKGDNFTFSCLPFDGLVNGSWFNSSSVSIQNSPPNTPTPTLTSTSTNNSLNDNLTCTTVIADLDADKMNVTINWTRNGAWNRTIQDTNNTNSYANGSTYTFLLGSGNLSINDVWSCQIQLFDGTNYSTWGSSSNLSIMNNPPIISTPSITPTIAFGNDTLVCQATPTDVDAQALNTTFTWLRYNNVTLTYDFNNTQSFMLTSGTTQTYNLSDTLTMVGDYWNCSVYASDGFNTSGNKSASIIIRNTPPNTPSPALTSANGMNTSDQDLNCSAWLYDIDSDTINVTINWTKNGVPSLVQQYGSYLNGTQFNATLGSGNLSNGDSWSCVMRLTDGGNYSAWANSNNVTILNSAPIMRSVSIVPIPAFANDTLLGYCNASDRDNQTILYSWKWYRNNVLNSSGSESPTWCFQEFANTTVCGQTTNGSYMFDVLGDFVNGLNAIDGNWITASSCVYHATADLYINYTKPAGATNNSLWQVYSSVDGLYNYTIPAACWNRTTLSFWITQYSGGSDYTDLECYTGSGWNDFAGTEYGAVFNEEAMYWQISPAHPQGIESNINNVSSTLLRKGDNWTLSCMANDSYLTSSWLNSTTLIIQNAPPNTPIININSSDGSNASNQNLNCWAQIFDIDNDTINVTINWTKNNNWNVTYTYNNSYRNGTRFNNTLGAGNLTVGDNWSCQIQTFDGTNYSSWGTSLTIYILLANSPPNVTTPIIGPNPAYTDSTLTCNTTVTDGEQTTTNGLNVTFYWYNNTILTETNMVAATNGTIVSNSLTSGLQSKGETWNCTVLASDGINTSTNKSAIIYINNTIPSTPILNYPANNDQTFTNRTVRFNWSASMDADNDNLNYSVEVSTRNDFDGTVWNTSVRSTNATYPTELLFNTYFWRVKAYDQQQYGNFSNVSNFTLVPLTDILLLNSTMDFGVLEMNSTTDTLDNVPYPFVIRNTGNCEANVSILATKDLFDIATLNTSAVQYLVNYSEPSSFNYASSATSWTNLTNASYYFMNLFNHSDANDEVRIDLKLNIPYNEPPGYKNTSVIFTANYTQS
jgi:hypothetical protein